MVLLWEEKKKIPSLRGKGETSKGKFLLLLLLEEALKGTVNGLSGTDGSFRKRTRWKEKAPSTVLGSLRKVQRP